MSALELWSVTAPIAAVVISVTLTQRSRKAASLENRVGALEISLASLNATLAAELRAIRENLERLEK